MKRTLVVTLFLTSIASTLQGQQVSTATTDKSPHTSQFVTVAPEVKLEVLDWGGTGRPIVLLAGLGNDAHVFDNFAPSLTTNYHVYGITRRGFGASSRPSVEHENYAADRLGDDVLAVVDALKLKRPVLVGHSVAGEELSSIGTRYPEKIAGLVYLDAGYAYAFYDADRGDMVIDRNSLEQELTTLMALLPPKERKAQVKELLDRSLPRFEKDLQELQRQLATVPDTAPVPPVTPATTVSIAIMSGARKYSGTKCPVLAIYALPHRQGPAPKDHPEVYEAMKAADVERTSAQAEAFATANPQAHVVRVPNADHYIFRSNEEDVVREMNTFLATLPE